MDQKLSCIIVEDEVAAAAMARDIIESNFPNVFISAITANIASAKQEIETLAPDFVVLDVNLEDGDAFELLKQLKEIVFKIIFVTSHDKYAVEAFKFSALDFLLKPYTPKQLIQAVEKVISQLGEDRYHLQLETLLQNVDGSNTPTKLILKNVEAVHVVPIATIISISADNNYSIFCLSDGREIMVSKTLKSFDEKLKSHGFFRIHQSHLINLDAITTIDKKNDKVVFSNHKELPISQDKKRMLLNYLDGLN
ncbi:LytTR family DNA-binding domain-containing protein [Maribacter sp.]|nr:LytTR family DNA-binding domain-containing protein [Maribacter sp.]